MTELKWLADIASFRPISTQFILSGNVRDVYPVNGELRSMEAAIWDHFRSDFKALLIWRPFEGVSLAFSTMYRDGGLAARQAAARRDCGLPSSQPGEDPAIDKLAELHQVLKAWADPNDQLKQMGLMIDCVGDVISSNGAGGVALAELLERQATRRKQDSFPPIFWVVPNANDVPHWFVSASSRIRQIVVPLPDRSTRTEVAGQLFRDQGLAPRLAERGLTEENKFVEALAEVSHNQQALALRGIATIAARAVESQHRGDARQLMRAAATQYRLGKLDISPWEDPSLGSKIRGARDVLGKAVIGQRQAIDQVYGILCRSYAGLSGAHVGNMGARPRGVLFFAGPTGVGKTEMAKTIAAIVFGDQDHYLRFDMSEFSEPHSVARLIGAPPGYVGFNDGGELVNAIRENPFRVILFDEIEKADSAILDKFLQILEDGRLTDGRGQTVYFSDCLIIFTSNLGINKRTNNAAGQVVIEPVVKYGDEPDDVQAKVLDGVQAYFKKEINRPELLNRIGENISVFQFIERQHGDLIADKFLGNVQQRMFEKGIKLSFSDAAKNQIYAACAVSEVLENGGRGIGSRIEKFVVNELSRFMFENDVHKTASLTITQLTRTDGGQEFAARYD